MCEGFRKAHDYVAARRERPVFFPENAPFFSVSGRSVVKERVRIISAAGWFTAVDGAGFSKLR